MTHAHGRLSSWVHRTRLSWLRLMNDLGAHGSTPAHAYFLFRWYVPRLDAQSAAVSREQERLADRLAADVAGPDTTAQALVAIEIGGHVFERKFWPGIFDRVLYRRDPPYPFAEMGPDIWATVADRAQLLAELLEPDTGSADTHPSLRERLARVGHVPQLPAVVTETGADLFLGDDRLLIASTLDQQWRSANAQGWQQRHDAARGARERLARLAAIEAPTPDEMFEHAELLEREGQEPQALERYTSAHAAGHAPAGLAAGRMLLDRDDEAGLPVIEAAMEAQSSLVEEGCRNAVTFLEYRGRKADAHRFRVRQTRHATLVKMAAAEREKLTVVDQFTRCADVRVDVPSLVRRLAIEPRVSRAFLVSKELRHSTGRLTILALLGKDAGDDLVSTLRRDGLIPKHVEIVALGRHDQQLQTALEQTSGALVYERAASVSAPESS
jgi:hypothetical protein